MTDAPRIQLLEYDDRFEVFDDFTKYNFEKPLQLPLALNGSFDHILADPPYHSEDCQRKCELSCLLIGPVVKVDRRNIQLQKQSNGFRKWRIRNLRLYFAQARACAKSSPRFTKQYALLHFTLRMSKAD